MKLVTFLRQPHLKQYPGIWLDGGTVLCLPDALALGADEFPHSSDMREAFSSLRSIIESGNAGLELLKKLNEHAESAVFKNARFSYDEITLLAPIPRPAKNIFCVGRNYLDHINEGYKARGMEVKLPEHIQLFSKPPTTVIGPGGKIRYDEKITQKLDYEIELGVVLGKSGRDIAEDTAMEHIFGYTVINDITARDLQRLHDQWFKGKGLDASCPMGPWIITKDEIADPQNIQLTLTVNGKIRQSASTSQMIFKLPAIISELSKGLTLEAGDIIATGTPSGVGYAMDPPGLLKNGDVVRCEISGIGAIVNTVVTV